ncbi:FimV/HubP family polar landmark protein [Azotobacter salinestris]|uniref:FimV/HubP family polar landmark protein n=1 Tax=Azotobacter salinestris TaxID=69964 RepID=UPI001266C711|nr:FimV/HubP family polar landmark protein [Azotobacter salinestris]
MVRVRKLALAIAAASALSSGVAHALGLGEVTLRSALNQPLVAEIELLEARDIDSEEVIPTLASPEEFNKAGVDRQYFLSDLKFTPIIRPNGKSVIRVTSTKPVREPYLNFLVEVLWPSGRLLREYTLLLDPPLYSSQTAMSAAQKPLTEQQAGVVSRAPAAATVPPAKATRPASPNPEAAGTPAKEYRTATNDTLWKVAERVKTSGTIHQTMLAIQDLNPQAFLDGNINRLVSGQVLRLPDEQQIRRRSPSQALTEVAEQNAAWRERRSRPSVASARQLDATRRTEAGAAPARVETGDSLRLVAADSGKAAAGSDQGADGKAAADKLALAKENLDATQRENVELKSRMDDLQSQLDKLQRLIALKDEQLAKLQANLAQPSKTGEAAAEAAVSASAMQGEPAAVVAPASREPSQPEAASVTAPALKPAGSSSEGASIPAEPVDSVPVQPETASTAPAQTAAVVASSMPPAAESLANKPAVQSVPLQPAPARPAAPQPPRPAVVPEPMGLVDSILSSPLLLPSLGGSAAAALLLGLLVARRRAAKKTDLQDEDDEVAMVDTRLDTGLSRAPIEPTLLDEIPGGRDRDVLSDAEEHIAYGRFREAAELLEAACVAEPKRSDLRLRLMEVHAELGDREGFTRQEKVLREITGTQSQVDHLRMKYPAMAGFATAALSGAALAAGLEALEEKKGLPSVTEEAEPSPPVFAADINLSLGDLEAELERDLQGSTQSNAALSLDDLTLDEALQPPLPAEEPLAEDFSFDLEFSSEATGFDREGDLNLKGLALELDMPDGPASVGGEDPLCLDLGSLEAPIAASGETASSESALLEEGLFDSFELAADGDFSIDSDLVAPKLELPSTDDASADEEASGLMVQLDELGVELEQLAVGLGESDGDMQPATHALGGLEEGEDFDFLVDADEIATKLDLARAYIDMGDTEGARDILEEVLSEGNEAQRQEAREMSARLA